MDNIENIGHRFKKAQVPARRFKLDRGEIWHGLFFNHPGPI